jgi:hypothetical protein
MCGKEQCRFVFDRADNATRSPADDAGEELHTREMIS